jgi:hypothetical protein
MRIFRKELSNTSQTWSLSLLNIYIFYLISNQNLLLNIKYKKLGGLSLRANYTDRATAACRRS